MWLRLPMIVRVGPNDPPEVQALQGTINEVLINTDNIVGIFRNVGAPDRSVAMLGSQVSVDIALSADEIWKELCGAGLAGASFRDLMKDVDTKQRFVWGEPPHGHGGDHSH